MASVVKRTLFYNKYGRKSVNTCFSQFLDYQILNFRFLEFARKSVRTGPCTALRPKRNYSLVV